MRKHFEQLLIRRERAKIGQVGLLTRFSEFQKLKPKLTHAAFWRAMMFLQFKPKKKEMGQYKDFFFELFYVQQAYPLGIFPKIDTPKFLLIAAPYEIAVPTTTQRKRKDKESFFQLKERNKMNRSKPSNKPVLLTTSSSAGMGILSLSLNRSFTCFSPINTARHSTPVTSEPTFTEGRFFSI